MNKFYAKFKKVTGFLIRRFKSFLKPYKIIIPSLIVAVVLIAGIVFYVDYNKTPTLTLSNLNEPVLTTEDPQFTIKGLIDLKSGSEVLINESKVNLESDGSFSYKLDLSEGKNDITITVTRNGKKITSQYIINYIPKGTVDNQSADSPEQTNQNTNTDQGVTTETETETTSNTGTDTSTSTPAPTLTPDPTPDPDPTPTPAPIEFQVSSVAVAVYPKYGPTCTKPVPQTATFNFTGTIIGTPYATVQYRWVQSDGNGSTGNFTLDSTGSQNVYSSWTVNGMASYAGWSRIDIISPNPTSSNLETFTRILCY